MADKNSKNRRRLLVGLIIIGIAAAGAGAGTMAWFSDTEQSADNTINAGTLDLDAPTGGSVTFQSIAPNETVPTTGGNISISVDYPRTGNQVDPIIANLSINTSHPANEPSNPLHNTTKKSADQFAKELLVENASVNVNGNQVKDLTGYTTLRDLSGTSLNNVSGLVHPGDTISLDLAFRFNKTAGNAFQADGVNMTVKFVGTQPR